MKIAITGATGFVGRYLVRRLAGAGHTLRCWHRPSSDLTGLESHTVDWLLGDLNDAAASEQLVSGCDAVVHAALSRHGKGFRGAEGDVVEFAQRNVIGSLRLIEAARRANVGRFIFISTCAVHEKILDDRPLDETHPVWPTSHYGAHKAAIEKFVHSYRLGMGGRRRSGALHPVARGPSGRLRSRPPEDAAQGVLLLLRMLPPVIGVGPQITSPDST